MTRIVHTDNRVSIGKEFFEENRDAKIVCIDAALTSIDGTPFSHCKALEAINVSSDNAAFSSEDGILYNKDFSALVRYPSAKNDRRVRIRESVLFILDNALSHVKGIMALYTGPNVKTLGKDCLNGCSFLADIHIGKDVVAIPVSATSACWNLARFIVDKDNEVYASYDGCLYSKNMEVLLRVPLGHVNPVSLAETCISKSQMCELQRLVTTYTF